MADMHRMFSSIDRNITERAQQAIQKRWGGDITTEIRPEGHFHVLFADPDEHEAHYWRGWCYGWIEGRHELAVEQTENNPDAE